MKNDKKVIEKKWKKVEQEEMKEEGHQLEMKEGYEQDESYEESED
ncbi:MAG: hypothetical protein V3U12_04185 [Nitrosopumilaceae archaeon]